MNAKSQQWNTIKLKAAKLGVRVRANTECNDINPLGQVIFSFFVGDFFYYAFTLKDIEAKLDDCLDATTRHREALAYRGFRAFSVFSNQF